MHLVLLERKKNDRTLHTSSEPEIEKPSNNENETSISDAETQSGNEHSPSDNEKDNDEVHEDSQPNEKEPDNYIEIEPPVDLNNPQPKNKIKETLWLGNTVKKENRGFKNLCLLHPSQLKIMMMKNLNALLKC